MIVWTGWGFVVAFIAIVGIVVGRGISPNSFTLALALAFLVAGAGTYGLARLLASRGDRVLIDPATNQRVIVRRDSLFSIPVRFWTWIFLALGVAMMLMAVFRS
jgi:hypothetical protein